MHTLMWVYDLPTVLKLAEGLDMLSAVMTANHKDQEAEMKRASKK